MTTDTRHTKHGHATCRLTARKLAASLAVSIAIATAQIPCQAIATTSVSNAKAAFDAAAQKYDDACTASEQAQQAAAASTSTSSNSGSGAAIVSYAEQFVGNPYVWGGSSLTNGVDCSHFVWLVLRDTIGYSGGYTTSGNWASRGTAVASLAQAQAGDIIVYSGHVAIYDGNGGIVEAKGSAYGITRDRSADHAPIVAIRRFV